MSAGESTVGSSPDGGVAAYSEEEDHAGRERARHRLYLKLEEVLGAEEAGTLMGHLPPAGYTELATKSDVWAVKNDLSAVKNDMAALEERLILRMESLEHRLTAQMHKLARQLVMWTSGMVLATGGLAFAAGRFV